MILNGEFTLGQLIARIISGNVTGPLLQLAGLYWFSVSSIVYGAIVDIRSAA